MVVVLGSEVVGEIGEVMSGCRAVLMLTGTFSIAYGVITDIATPAERGSYVSIVSFAWVHDLPKAISC